MLRDTPRTWPVPEHYGLREVVWLLSLDHEEAVAFDASPTSSFPDLLSSSSHSGSTGASDDREVLAVLRWHDVHRARRLVEPLIDEEVLELRLKGLTEHQIGIALERSQSTVNRQFSASIDEILRELGTP